MVGGGEGRLIELTGVTVSSTSVTLCRDGGLKSVSESSDFRPNVRQVFQGGGNFSALGAASHTSATQFFAIYLFDEAVGSSFLCRPPVDHCPEGKQGKKCRNVRSLSFHKVRRPPVLEGRRGEPSV